jgi:iron complex outermembrane recepter protein
MVRTNGQMKKMRAGLCCGAATLALGLAASAGAQTATAPDSKVLTAIEEIVVTAERRSESQQSVPIAVTAVSEAMMERQQITSIQALDRLVPNIVINQNTGTSSASKIFLRGVGEDESFFTADTPVGIYVDDVYIARQTGAMFDLFDVERMELLRGPQGTLYGRNTSAGALKLVSRKPSLKESTAQADLTLGNFGQRSVRASANMVVSETVALQVAGLVKKRDGFTDNVFNGDSVNNQDVRGARASLLIQPNESLRLTLVGDIIREDSSPGYPTPLVIDRSNPALARPTSQAKLGDFFKTNSDIDTPQNDIDQNGLSATLEWDASDSLTLKSISSFRELSNLLYLDADGDRLAAPAAGQVNPARFHLFQDQIQWQASQEFQATGTALDGKLNYVGGVFYFFEWNDQQTKSVIGIPALLALGIPTGLFSATNTADETLKTSSYAAFGSATYNITDQLGLTVGLRWTEETKRYTNAVLLPTGAQQVVCLAASRLANLAAAPCTAAQTAAGGLTFANGSGFEATWSDWTPRFVLDYQWTDDILTYLSAAKGFKGGTTSGRTTAASENFSRLIGQPETNWSYEAGLKADWLDGKLRTNLAAFYNEYTGLQFGVTLPSGGFGRINAGNATIKGLELEATAVPVSGLELFGNLGLLDGEYDTFSASLGTCTAQGITTLNGLLGLDLKQTPEWSYRVGFSYAYDAGSVGVFSLGSDYTAKAKHYNNLCNSEGIAVKDYEALNAQLSWEDPRGNWLVTLAGKNLTDAEVFNGGFDFAQSLGFASAYMYPPATYTLNVRFKF